MHKRATLYGEHFDAATREIQAVGRAVRRAEGGCLSDLAILREIIEDGEAKLRGVQATLREVEERASMISRDGKMRELAGEIRRKYSVSYTAPKRRQPLFCVREMDMKKGDSADPGDQPRQDQ